MSDSVNVNEKVLPLLPLRDVVIYPYMLAPLFVGREKSIKALEEAAKGSKEIFLSAQKDAKVNEPGNEDMYKIGTIGTIVQMLRLPDGTGLWLSWARYLTGSGESIHPFGIEPEIGVAVRLPELGEPLPEEDAILERAVEEVREPAAEAA